MEATTIIQTDQSEYCFVFILFENFPHCNRSENERFYFHFLQSSTEFRTVAAEKNRSIKVHCVRSLSFRADNHIYVNLINNYNENYMKIDGKVNEH